jgi:uncharacterized membrane protein YvbJ
MKCVKCGESLHPEQKACLRCGTQTHNWPGGPAVEEKPAVVIPWKKIGVIGGAAVALIVLAVVLLGMRTVPPDQVTNQWVRMLTNRKWQTAQQFTTADFERSITEDQSMSERRSDEFFEFMYENGGTFAVSAPQYDSPTNPTSATVTITFTGTNGQSLTQAATLMRQGKEWKITSCN